MQQLKFHWRVQEPTLPKRTLLKSFLIGIFKTEGFALKSVDFIFCSDAEILRLNKKFLNHDYHTDILTFDLRSTSGVQSEIYISLPTVRKNSTLYNTPFQNELYRVIIHGVLHLCGYRDDKIALKTIMHDKQEKYLLKYLDLLKKSQF